MRAFFNDMSLGSIQKRYVQGVLRKTKAKRHTQYLSKTLADIHKNQNQNVYRDPRSNQRLSVNSIFRRFTKDIVPVMESSLQERLLKKFQQNFLTHQQKRDIEKAYLKRKQNVRQKGAQLQASEVSSSLTEIDTNIQIDQAPDLFINKLGGGLKFHTYKDIGRYTIFPSPIFQNVFPNRMTFGTLEKEVAHTGKYGIMTREQGLKLAYDFSWIKTATERKDRVDYMGLLQSDLTLKQIMQDQDVFNYVYQDLCDVITNYLNLNKTDHESHAILSNPNIFNGIVGVLMAKLKTRPLGYHLLHPTARKSVVQQFLRLVLSRLIQKNLRPNDFTQVIGLIGSVVLKLDNRNLVGLEHIQEQMIEAKKKRMSQQNQQQTVEKEEDQNKFQLLNSLYKFNAPKQPSQAQILNISFYQLHLEEVQMFNQTHWRPFHMRKAQVPGFKGFNTGAFLWGDSGSGKSQILTYLTMWAHQSEWVVLPIPHARMFLQGEQVTRHRSGLYLQLQTAQRLLMNFRNANYKILSEFEVDLELYGKCDMAGVHQDDIIVYPTRYIHQRRVFSDEWKKHLLNQQKIAMKATSDWQQQMYLGQLLKEPKTLLDVVNAGIQNMNLATCAFGEVLVQLYASEKYKAMILIDQYNHWFKPSNFHSFRYMDVPRARRGFIPPWDMAIPRMFMKFDGQFIKNGVKVVASSVGSWFKHEFNPQMIDFNCKGFDVKVGGMALDDFRNACHYYYSVGFPIKPMDEMTIQGAYQDTQGNWNQMHINAGYNILDTY